MIASLFKVIDQDLDAAHTLFFVRGNVRKRNFSIIKHFRYLIGYRYAVEGTSAERQC